MLREFREFINRGNVMDLAVAVIIAGAFGAIVTSLVNDIIMPIIGVILGGIDFSGLAVTIGDAAITYGTFIQAVINFLIIAFVIFLLVRTVNNMQKRLAREAKAAPPPEAPIDVQLLTEIRDLLKANLQDWRLTRGGFRQRGKQVNDERTVLIVDDHPNFRQALNDVLTFLAPRWQIVEARDGQEGLTLAQQLHPDLILLDLQMPVMDGYALSVALQGDPALAAIPRVLLTSEELDHPLVRRTRSQAVIAKPFSMADLEAALQRALNP